MPVNAVCTEQCEEQALHSEFKEKTLAETKGGHFKIVKLFQACSTPVSSVNQLDMKKQVCYHPLTSPSPTTLEL